MTPFAALLERLAFTPARNAKLRLIGDYLARTPDPDRGWALAALTGDLKLRALTPTLLRGMVEERVDAELFRLSYDFVGDLAETIALIWPGPTEGDADLRLSEVVETLMRTGKAELPGLLPAGSTGSARPSATRFSSSAPGRCASASRRGWRRRRLRRMAGSRPTRSARSGTGWRRPIATSSPGSRAGRSRVRSARGPLPAGDAGHPRRSRDARPARPRGLPRRVEMGRRARPGGGRGRRAPALHAAGRGHLGAPFPTSSTRSTSRA
jgi:hypothetical protein